MHFVSEARVGMGVGAAKHLCLLALAAGGSSPELPLQVDVVVPEAARFAALKSATLSQQMRSPVVLGLAAYFTASVFVLQLYLGAHHCPPPLSSTHVRMPAHSWAYSAVL